MPPSEASLPEVPDHWYQPVAEFLGRAYLRNAFTKGTVREIDFLVPMLGLDLTRGHRARVLDAGCGPGRHSLELARRGFEVTGVDISPKFVEIAREDAAAEGLDVTFRLGDLRELDETSTYDAVICLCEGGFGLAGAGVEADLDILARLARALVPGGALAISAFSAAYAVASLEKGSHRYDPATGLFHETAELRNEDGQTARVPMATRCYTPQELALMARIAGLEVSAVHGVDPGAYAATPPTLDRAELLMLARAGT